VVITRKTNEVKYLSELKNFHDCNRTSAWNSILLLWYRVFFEKLIIALWVKKFLAFMVSKCSTMCSQNPIIKILPWVSLKICIYFSSFRYMLYFWPILFAVIALVVFGELYKLWSLSLCNFLQRLSKEFCKDGKICPPYWNLLVWLQDFNRHIKEYSKLPRIAQFSKRK